MTYDVVLQGEDASRLWRHAARTQRKTDTLAIEMAGSVAGGEGASDGSGGAHVRQ